MRVRTYGFPGDLRGLPEPRLATTPTNRPRRSLSSPGMPCLISVALTLGFNENDAVPGHLRGTRPFRPWGPSGLGGAASHLDGLALWRLGSASESKLRLPSAESKSFLGLPRIFREKHARPRGRRSREPIWGSQTRS